MVTDGITGYNIIATTSTDYPLTGVCGLTHMHLWVEYYFKWIFKVDNCQINRIYIPGSYMKRSLSQYTSHFDLLLKTGPNVCIWDSEERYINGCSTSPCNIVF